MTDNVNHPEHYNLHPAGIECITVVEPFTFNVGSAMKYLWRAGLKGDAMEDLMKAHWYVVREIGRLQRGQIEEALTRRLHEHLAGFQAAAQAQAEEPVAAEQVSETAAEGQGKRGKRW